MSFQQTLVNRLFFKQLKKKQINLSSFSIITIGILLGLISLLNSKNNFEHYFLKALQLILFFGFGMICISFQKNFEKVNPTYKPRNFVLPIAILLCAVLSAIYIFFRKEILIMAFSSSAAFVIPFFLNHSWTYFNNIPDKEYDTWIPKKRISNTASIFLDCISVKIKIARRYFDVHEQTYSVYAPYYIKLGDFFSRFLEEKNRNIETAIEDIDKAKNKYAWEFFITDLYGLQLRRLDPNLTLVENKIKQDAIIYLKRTKEPVKLLYYAKQNLINETIK